MTSGTGLTDKQMKVAEAIRSREYKLQACFDLVLHCAHVLGTSDAGSPLFQ